MTDEEWLRLRDNDPEHCRGQHDRPCMCLSCQARRRDYWADPANQRMEIERKIQDKRNQMVWAARDIEYLQRQLAALPLAGQDAKTIAECG